jgi:hypothetical protein
MLTVPIEASTAAANGPARILVIGRSENVLSEAVTILRDMTPSRGRSAYPSADHSASPSSPGGPPRSCPRSRKARH